VISNIKPIINLGWMMSAGIALSLIISFIVFPTVLMLLPKGKIKKKELRENKYSFTQSALNIVLRDKKAIFITTAFILLFSLTGHNLLLKTLLLTTLKKILRFIKE